MKRKIDLVKLWIKKAENDLITAEHSLNIKPTPPTDTICFHAQQCAEKYLKAYLIYKDVQFEKVHDLGDLVSMCTTKAENFKEIHDTVEELTPFAVDVRYPGVYEEITLEEAHEAVEVARKTKEFVIEKLPKQVTKDV